MSCVPYKSTFACNTPIFHVSHKFINYQCCQMYDMDRIPTLSKLQKPEMHSPFGHVMDNVHTWGDRHKKSIVLICDCDQHTTTNTQPDFDSVLIKDGTKFEGSKM